LIFDPLLPALAGAQRIVFALDDELHLVPIDALPLDPDPNEPGRDPGLIGHSWQVETRTTLTELLGAPAPRIEGANRLIALGGAAFDSDPTRPPAKEPGGLEETDRSQHQSSVLMQRGVRASGFPALPYTGVEARGVAALHEEAFGGAGERRVLEGSDASRAALESAAHDVRWLHVATHGWFAPDAIRSWADPGPIDEKTGLGVRVSAEEQVRGSSPMLLCGLALAGANLPEDAVGRVPGLVTAQELSSLDLEDCELVVLSACDTNIGERRAGQGVASMQKALQMAGARSVITSSWKVPDEPTKELMLDFYRRLWVERKPKGRALWEAKMRLRAARDEQGNPRYSTRDWAGWTLTGIPD
jgi:CHAT domain-containing protein